MQHPSVDCRAYLSVHRFLQEATRYMQGPYTPIGLAAHGETNAHGTEANWALLDLDGLGFRVLAESLTL